MKEQQKVFTFFLRIALGTVFFYAGITKVFDPSWSAAGYLKGAKTFVAFYHFLTAPGILPLVNFLNEWGLTLLGASLLLGIFVRLSSWLGALLMLLYYLPMLHPPFVDQHIIYVFALLLLGSLQAGRIWGLEK